MKVESKIMGMIEAMSIDEMKARLLEYMANDTSLMPRLVAVEIRETAGAKSRYDVLLIDEQGNEIPIIFRDRYSRLIYIYTLLQPQGYHRRTLETDNYRTLCRLYSQLYFEEGDALLKSINSTDYNHFFSQSVAQSRTAVRQASPLSEEFAIARPQSNNGKVLIPFVNQGGTAIIAPSLLNDEFHF